MDSLTQITLGAAMGELVLGRRIGNRAMVWGAIAGTIPDLDVFSRFWMTEIEALAFHRGVTHSLVFAVVTPFLFGWLTHRYYQSGFYRKPPFRQALGSIWLIMGLLLVMALVWAGMKMPPLGWVLILPLAALAGWRSFSGSRVIATRDPEAVEAGYRGWVLLFFWAIFTHPLLDAFTPYGTQLFYPFSDHRVAFNAIAVVDPIYTFPFLGALILAARLPRHDARRLRLTRFGVIWSSAYLLLCTLNKVHIDGVFARSLAAEGVVAQRLTTAPTPFNNLLWQGVAETPELFYLGSYSLLDPEPRVRDFREVPKRQALPPTLSAHPDVGVLRWFSNGYYIVEADGPDRYLFNDLRYGGIWGLPGERPTERFIFRFELAKGDSGLAIRQLQPDRSEMGQAFAGLWSRLLGHLPRAE